MEKIRTIALAVFASGLAVAPAFAHALLDHAVPSVGGHVSGSPKALELNFSEGVTAGFSGVEIASAEGGDVVAGNATVDPGQPNVLHVRFGHALKPGVYVVRWHVVSVDTHRTSGRYKFTIDP
jgi:methionine-rich copper-binding protein CopC